MKMADWRQNFERTVQGFYNKVIDLTFSDVTGAYRKFEARSMPQPLTEAELDQLEADDQRVEELYCRYRDLGGKGIFVPMDLDDLEDLVAQREGVIRTRIAKLDEKKAAYQDMLGE